MATRGELRDNFLLLLGGFILLGVSACTTLTPEQQVRADALRAMAEETTKLYGKRPIHIMFGPDVEGRGGSERGSMITFSNRMLKAPEWRRDVLMAHELAHYVLDHDWERTRARGSIASYAEWWEYMKPLEFEANAKSVEILQRVKHLSEAEALQRVYAYMIRVHWRQQKRGLLVEGHHPACVEIADLLNRFQFHQYWTKNLECAPDSIHRVTLPPTREGSLSDLVKYAYFTATPRRLFRLMTPRATRDFYAGSDEIVTFYYGLKNVHEVFEVKTRWIGPNGKTLQPIFLPRRMMHQNQSRLNRYKWIWQTQWMDMPLLRDQPGLWTVEVLIDDEMVGRYSFTLHPGRGE